MKRLAILLAISSIVGLIVGLPLLLVSADDAPPTPDVYALQCFTDARQGPRLDDRERWTVDDAREQWQAEHAQGRLPVGCFSTPPYRCKEGCE